MTVNSFIKAAAAKLGELFPKRLVYTDEIHADADGNFFIRCIEQRHETKLDRRRRRFYSFEILYFDQKGEPMSYNDWAETMYLNFERLTVGGSVFHLTNAHAENGDDGVFHFVFDADFTALLAPEEIEKMRTLEMTEGVKNG